ncbi:MAG: ABC transporter permease, partial [Bacteroidales bacterium]|nr:ABC transporter permease [Bacteroidales bacterium]
MNSFINFLKRNKLYSAVNLLGLSLSMAFVLLLAVYVTSQLGIDSFNKNADRIYVIAQKETLSTGYWLPRHMKANFPEIERSASYSTNGLQEYKIDGNTVNARTSYADSSFFDIFSFPLVEGDFREWKASTSGVLISESFAKAQFADKDPVGREIRFDGADSTVSTLTVSGVFKDIENSIIKPCDIFLRGEIMTITNLANDERMSNSGSSTCFVMAYPNADLPARHDDILKWCRENWWTFSSDYGGDENDVRIIPLRDVYFLSDGNEDYNDSLILGNKTTVMLLAGMCFLLLLFAILNYVNMTTALSGFRAKEMATRRLIGATKGGIFLKMIVESTIICAAAMVVAILLGEALSPAVSKALN